MAFVDHHVIGQCLALCAAGLGGNHLVGQGHIDAVALHQSRVLHGLGRIDQQDPVQPRIHLAAADLGQKRNRRQRLGAGGLLALLLHQAPDRRMLYLDGVDRAGDLLIYAEGLGDRLGYDGLIQRPKAKDASAAVIANAGERCS